MNPNHEPTPIGALSALQFLLQQGCLPEDLPASLQTDLEFQSVARQIEAIQLFTLRLANGDLETDLSEKGRMAGALKSLQANLRHLTWQTQRVAEGDLNQRVRFMGDFSAAFNRMVENLQNSHQSLDLRAQQLNDGRRAALNLMLDAESAYQKLQSQMEEINALQAQLQHQAIRDPLTDCFNRRYLNETLEREFARAVREGYPLSLIMADIDHFKHINDIYGHPAGDVMLRAIGELFRSRMRAGDIVCRYGGEEFLIVMPNINLMNALKRAEVLREAFAQLCVDYENQSMQATISIGVAVFPFHGATSEQVIKAADQALYQAKNLGRNCVQGFEVDP